MIREVPQWLFYFTAGPLLRFLLRAEVSCPASIGSRVRRPLIIAANHRCRVDPFLVTLLPLSLIRRLVPFAFPTAEREYRKWWQKPITLLGAYSLPKLALSMDEYLAPTASRLAKGDAILIFPEGRINSGDREQVVKPGVAMLARKHGAMVVPMLIEGTEAAGWKSILQRRAVVKVTVGEPLRLNESLTDEDSAREILAAIAALGRGI